MVLPQDPIVAHLGKVTVVHSLADVAVDSRWELTPLLVACMELCRAACRLDLLGCDGPPPKNHEGCDSYLVCHNFLDILLGFARRHHCLHCLGVCLGDGRHDPNALRARARLHVDDGIKLYLLVMQTGRANCLVHDLRIFHPCRLSGHLLKLFCPSHSRVEDEVHAGNTSASQFANLSLDFQAHPALDPLDAETVHFPDATYARRLCIEDCYPHIW
mmetsp:Transcript_12819/g.35477  ORF Transcript_12819/g.35477 Transcript_12819/m.35477 type:complete len:216 (+) Transcript_12819:1217-1864(+)